MDIEKIKQDFIELTDLIFCETFRINKTNHGRVTNKHYLVYGGNLFEHSDFPSGVYPAGMEIFAIDSFRSNHLKKDLDIISKGESDIPNPNKYELTIKEFFKLSPKSPQTSHDLAEQLLTTLINKSYCQVDTDSRKNWSIDQYITIFTNCWKSYHTNYRHAIGLDHEPQRQVEITVSDHALPADITVYEKKMNLFLETRKEINFDHLTNIEERLRRNIESDYDLFFKKTLFNNNQGIVDDLTASHRSQFFYTLYEISDILDKLDHEDACKVNLELLSFFNKYYQDDYVSSSSPISIDDIRRIQGCTYAIAVRNTQNPTHNHIVLSENNNLIYCRNENGGVVDNVPSEEKFNICLTALTTLLKNKKLSDILDKINWDDANPFQSINVSPTEEKRELISILQVLSLIFNNIATIHLQFIKFLREDNGCYSEYHEKSRLLRNLIIELTKDFYGMDSDEYKDAVRSLASSYNSLATFFYYKENYAKTIIIRSILYQYYKRMELDQLANNNLMNSPIMRYEEQINARINNPITYENYQRELERTYKNDFDLLTPELLSYNDYKKIIEWYREFR